MHKFNDLEICKRSRLSCSKIYASTSSFPESEKFGLTNQLRRASVSIPSNIAEGSSRKSNKEHIEIIKLNKTVGIVAGLFIDIINNLEKVGDHCDNIAKYVIGNEDEGELDLEAIDNLIAD